jgi:hypothetical protein
MSSEFFLVLSLILVGLIFFSIFQTYSSTQIEETKRAEEKAFAEKIVSLIYRISKDSSEYFMYCFKTAPLNLSIENGIIKYERGKYVFTFLAPENLKEEKLIESTRICIVKKGKFVSLSQEKKCVSDNICSLDECKEDCPDCYGPENICLGDGFCNIHIGENCRNSKDCSCSYLGINYVCCPENPKSNQEGCV